MNLIEKAKKVETLLLEALALSAGTSILSETYTDNIKKAVRSCSKRAYTELEAKNKK